MSRVTQRLSDLGYAAGFESSTGQTLGKMMLGIPSTVVRLDPFTGEAVPVWIANFVLAEYGTGAAERAAVTAAYLHGLAGRRAAAEGAVTAVDVARQLPPLFSVREHTRTNCCGPGTGRRHIQPV